jgi:hypothetical protein
MFVGERGGAVITTLLQDMPHMPAAARQPPHRSWIELSATLDFMLATLVGNGARMERRDDAGRQRSTRTPSGGL